MKIENCAALFAPYRGGKLFVGFSGGADSTAALLTAREFAHRFSIDLCAVHFDHGLRGAESTAEADAAENFAREHDIAFLRFELKLTAGANLESAARDARLKIWKKLAGTPDSAVVLGHHIDDRVETLFLRLTRGANATGLAAMRAKSRVHGVTFLRPLLYFSRLEIEEFLQKQGIYSWATDSSNRDETFARNYLRNHLLPELYTHIPSARNGLHHTIAALDDDADFLEMHARIFFDEISGANPTPLHFWHKLPAAMLPRVLRLWLTEQNGCEFIPTTSLLERIRMAADTPTPEPRRCDPLLIQHDCVFFSPDRPQPEAVSWEWHTMPNVQWGEFLLEVKFAEQQFDPCDPDSVYFDADQLETPLLVTARCEGDHLIPFGKTQPQSLKKLRTDRKIPARLDLPVLRDSRQIVWAAAVRHCAVAPVTQSTRRIVSFTLRPRKK